MPADGTLECAASAASPATPGKGFFSVPSSSLMLLIVFEYRGHRGSSHPVAIKLPGPGLPEEVSMSPCTQSQISHSLSSNHLTNYQLLGTEREKTPKHLNTFLTYQKPVVLASRCFDYVFFFNWFWFFCLLAFCLFFFFLS